MAGQLVQRGKNKWLVRVFLGRDANGKRKYYSKVVHGTKKEAQTYLTKLLRQRDTGELVEPSRKYLKDYLQEWLETAVRPRVREVTFESYQDVIRLYIVPHLGDTRLTDLTPAQIQAAYNALSEQGLSARTVRYAHSILRDALEQAVKWQMLPRNPAQYVDLPRQKKKEMRALSPQEAKRFLEEAAYSRWQALFSLLITTGMRPGEALGLKWEDIDFHKGRVSIRRTMTRDGRLEEPKTPGSRRVISLPKSVLIDLKNHRRNQLEEKLRAKEYNDQGLVFANENGGPVNYRNLIRRHFKPLLKRAGLPEDIRLYDLRHTCATLLLAAGENPKVVSERLGHSSVTLTLDTYSHVLPDLQQRAADKLERLLF